MTSTLSIPTRTVYTTAYGERTTSLEEAIANVTRRLERGQTRVEVRADEEPMTIDISGDPYLSHTDDRSRIADAFRSLRKTHLTAMGRHCCSSCMAAEQGPKAQDKGKGTVGFNRQAWDAFDRDRTTLVNTLHLQHGEPHADGDDSWDLTPLIVDALRAQGLPAEWSGDGMETVIVHPRSMTYCHGQHEEGSRESRWCRNCRAVREGKEQYERSLDRAAYDRVSEDPDHASFSDLRRARRLFPGPQTFRQVITELREGVAAA